MFEEDLVSHLEWLHIKGHSILKELTELSLLGRSSRENHVKMPEHLRVLALSQLDPKEHNGHLLIEAGQQMKEYPAEEKCEKADRLFLMCSRLQCLSKSPKYEKVSTHLI